MKKINYLSRSAAIILGVIVIAAASSACASSGSAYLATSHVAAGGHLHLAAGTVVHALPVGHKIIWVGKTKYHAHRGVFYLPVRGGYKIVHAPVGAAVTVLPAGYKKVIIARKPYYHFRGSYYRWDKAHKRYVVIKRPR